MRTLLTSFGRLIAGLLLMTILASRIAMAAYLCPQVVPAASVSQAAMAGMPCASMDLEQPSLCAEFQVGEKLALELAAAPVLSAVCAAFIIPLFAAPVPGDTRVAHHCAPLIAGTDPPYLRTLRIRI